MDKGERLLKKPVYKGGKKAMSQFIQKHINYPKKALEKKVEGIVTVRIDINQHGFVTKAKSIKKLGSGCDEEAERVASLLEFFVESKRKVRITFHKNINVQFTLPRPKVAASSARPEKPAENGQGMKVVYTFVPAKKK